VAVTTSLFWKSIQISDKAYRKHDVPRAFVLHSNSPEALASKCQFWLAALQKDDSGQQYFNFVTEAENANVPSADARLGFVAKDQVAVIEFLTTALEQLNTAQDEEPWNHPGGIHYRARALLDDSKLEDSKVVALFSGQGSQYINMCKDLTLNFPPMRESFAKMGQLLLNDNETTLSSAVFPEQAFDEAGKKIQQERLKQTQYIQPAIGSVSVGLFKMMQQSGFKADMVAGHSYGELTALWAAGAIDDDGFYSLSRSRCIAMGTSPEAGYDAGAMLAIMGDAKAIEQKVKDLDQVSIANYNSPKQLVVAGPSQAIASAAESLKNDGFSVVALPVPAAFHSSLVAYADKPFSDAIEKQAFKKPHTTIFSNVTAKPYPKSAKEIKQSFKSNMLNSVQFTQEINAIADQGGSIFVEFGPKNVLTRLVNSILADRPHIAIALNSSSKENSDTLYRDALVQLKVAGVELDLKDIYQPDVEQPVSKKPGMNIRLNGANYVSETTKKAFEDTLNDGFQLTLPKKPGVSQQSEPMQASQAVNTTTATAIVKEASQSTANNAPAAEIAQVDSAAQGSAAQGLNQSEWLQAQSATMSAHETYLQNQQEYSQGFFNMMHHLVDEFGAKNRAVPDSISQSMSELHQYQQDTLQVHQSYLQGQIEFNKSSHQFIGGESAGSYQAAVTAPVPATKRSQPLSKPAVVQQNIAQSAVPVPVVPAPAPAPVVTAAPVLVQAAVSGLDSASIQKGMLEIVHDKTGYPVEMLDLNMNMEADLGIDSIKRVEILGAMTVKFPELPELDQNALAEMQTLLEIVEYVAQQAGAMAPADAAPAPVAAAASTSGLDSAAIQKGMLEIVHDKTGYPVEMLDLNMNMEADLGIDSIKRVEILGAMTAKFPDLPELDQNALAEMQTLKEIVEYVETQSSVAEGSQATEVETISAASVLDEAAIQQSMLEIVNEKTGYPVEMLDLTMDLEADLGIDSIKRVEILGAMTAKFPELPEMDQNALSEMGTLAEIVDYVKSLVPQDSSISRALSEQAEVVGAAVNDASFSTTESVVVKKYLPRPDTLESELSVTERSCLITDNGEKITYNTAKALQDLGWNVTVMQFPASLVARPGKLPEGVQIIKLAKATDAELEKTLNAVCSAQTLNGFIHLSARPADKGSKIKFSKREMTILKMVFFTAKYLQNALTTNVLTTKAAQGRNFFITTSYMDGEIGTAGRNRFELSQGGLNGLVKTLNLEWEDIFCRAIDLSPDIDDNRGAQILIDELFDPDLSIIEVGHCAKGRMTLTGEVRAHAALETANDKISESSVFLVSGGAKGVTAACLMPLAELYHCRFILAGRASYSGSDPEWAKGRFDDIDDDTELKRKIMQLLQAEGEKPTPVIVNKRLRAIKSDREISNTLNQIAARGGKAEYISADVTDSVALKEKVVPAVAKLGKITGLIHGAGVLADKPIQKKTEADFNAVLNTKIDGLEAMLSLVKKEELEYLLLFSSAAGFYGNNGQSDYAVANEILNKTAYQFRHYYPDCHVVSFNWGPWDGGMVTAELKSYFQQRNVEIIPMTEGVEIFANELHQERGETIQLLVGSSMRSDVDNSSTPLRTFQINTRLLLEDNPFLNDHVIGGSPVLPSATALSWMANICERLSPCYHFFECNDFQVLKGIVFDKAQAESYQVDVKGLSNDNNISRFQVTISSKNSSGKQVWHYRADILVAKELPAVPMYTQSDLSETESTTGETLYKNGTLFHGSLFQGIEKVINTSMKKLTLLCNLDKIKDVEQGQFPISSINPFATDLMFQAMLVWVRKHRHLGSLPLKFLKVVNYKLIPDREDFYISLDVGSTSETNMTADVVIHDQNGLVYSRAFGAEVTVSPGLNSMFTKK